MAGSRRVAAAGVQAGWIIVLLGLKRVLLALFRRVVSGPISIISLR
jgi:hypothetical protein